MELFHLENRCSKLMSSLKASWPPYFDFSNMFNQCWGFHLKWPTHQHPYLGNYIPNCRPWFKHMTLHQSPIWTLRIHTLCLDGWNLLMQNLKKNLELTFTQFKWHHNPLTHQCIDYFFYKHNTQSSYLSFCITIHPIDLGPCVVIWGTPKLIPKDNFAHAYGLNWICPNCNEKSKGRIENKVNHHCSFHNWEMNKTKFSS